MDNKRWVLPEGIEEQLPSAARQIERLRRELLDLFFTWGYELVIPPFVEYTDSLLTGIGGDLDLQTFKLVDQKSGRMMGIRADMTPQVARIDAHQLGREHPTRLCYMGTVLRTHADDLSNKRSLMQIGAELYGHAGVESDIEIIRLMIAMLDQIKLGDIYLDLGHVGIFRGLSRQAGFDEKQEALLFDILQRKAAPELNQMLRQVDMPQKVKTMLAELVWLNGGVDVLKIARDKLKSADKTVLKAIENLEIIAAQLQKHCSHVELHFDLAELRGYNYHTGVVFAAYKPGIGQSISQGGRYDHIGEAFGRARPATGFTADLRALMEYSAGNGQVEPTGIYAPTADDDDLLESIATLRAKGERVVSALPNQPGGAREMGCDCILVKESNKWVISKINK